MKKTYILWIALSIALVIAVAVTVSLRATSNNHILADGRPGQVVEFDEAAWNERAAQRPAAPAPYSAWNEGDLKRSLQKRITAGKLKLKLKSDDDAALLAARSAEVVAAFWTSDLERYRSVLRDQGLTVPNDLAGPSAEATMKLLTASVADAPVDIEALQVDLWAIAGKPLVPNADPGPGVFGVTRAEPRGDRDIVDPGAAGADVVVVGVPAYLLDAETALPFTGTMALYFARRPADGDWLLVKVESRASQDSIRPDKPAPSAILPPL